MKKIKEFNCPVEVTIEIIGGRWKPLIISQIGESSIRFNQLRNHIPNISQRILTKQLRDLEEAGIIHRNVHDGIPLKVEYQLTELGKTVLPPEICDVFMGFNVRK